MILRTEKSAVSVKVTVLKGEDARFELGKSVKGIAPGRDGILVDLGREVEAAFSMKDTSIPLSAAFLDKEAKVLAVYDLKPFEEKPFRPPFRYRYVLTIKQSLCAKRGIGKDSKVILPDI